MAHFTEVPLELACKASNNTLLSLNGNLIDTVALTSLSIDKHDPNHSKFYDPKMPQGIYIPFMNPQSMRFAQHSISPTFKNDDQLLEEIIIGEGQDGNYRTQMPPVKLTFITHDTIRTIWPNTNEMDLACYPEGLYTLDHRRLYIYKRLYECQRCSTTLISQQDPIASFE